MLGHEFGVGHLVMSIVNLIWPYYRVKSLKLYFFFNDLKMRKLSNLNNSYSVFSSPSPVIVDPELCKFPRSSPHPKQGTEKEGGRAVFSSTER